MNTISMIVNAVIHVILVALVFLLWKMWEDVIMCFLLRTRVMILGRTKVKVEVGKKEEQA